VPGVALSRWTLSFFAAALTALLAAECMMALGYGYPAAALAAPQTLILVHLVTIGWLSLLLCGALFQFVPVLVAHPIYSNTLPLPALLCLVTGLGSLILGFLQLAGHVGAVIPWFAIAAVLLGCGFVLVLWILGRTLWAARPLTLPARFVTVGLCSIAATASLGILFALTFAGMVTFPPLLDLAAQGLPLHIIAGLGGWLTFTAMGVSYRLLAMFMLAPEPEATSTRWALRLGAAALIIAIGGGVAAVWMGVNLGAVLIGAAVVALTSLALYARDIVQMYRQRRRRVIELNSRMAAVALSYLTATVLLAIIFAGLGVFTRYLPVLVFLIGFGWLSGLGLAKLYKIVAFLTWLECYGPVLGKTKTPRVQDLVVERRAIKWFWLHFAAVAVGALCLLADAPLSFRMAAAAMVVATVGIIVELVRTRRLVNVTDALRLPEGVRKPQLLLCFVHP
jgi:hypothetical protein